MKRLQEDTMCKMAVLGRGSMRDRKKEEELRTSGDTRYAHLFEDLHVEISTFAAPAEAHARIAYALAEVRRFLVPDYHDDIRQEQMWEMQALTSTPTINFSCDQLSPNRGGITDMDTSNDDKLENETNVMECTTLDKTDSHQTNLNCDHSQQQCHLPHLISQARGPTITNNNGMPSGGGDTLSSKANATAFALQHQLTAASISGILNPAAGVTSVTDLKAGQSNASVTIPSETDTPGATLRLLEPAGTLLHPTLRSVKAINIAGGLARKRPLLGVPRTGMNPTKRTVMTLLARAKNSQAFHSVRSPVASAPTARFTDHLQMLASPFILSAQSMDQATIAFPKESLAQGV